MNWENLLKDAVAIRQEWADLWLRAEAGVIPIEQAKRTLEVLWMRSHLDYAEHFPDYDHLFPTTQGYRNRLSSVSDLWWVDHATAGINGWGTLTWFSSQAVKHAIRFGSEAEARGLAGKKNKYKAKIAKDNGVYTVKWTGPAEAVTHFVVFADGTPFQLLPLEDGAWGEPKRNGDALQVEMVNALVVHRDSNTWHYWAGIIPDGIVQVQRPQDLDRPFRGVSHMLPYTWDQVIANIKLKRLCRIATGERMGLDRMSQHTDWRESKFDMGPLWPFDLCNQAAFENFPIESYAFVQQFVRAAGVDTVVDATELAVLKKNAEDPGVYHDLSSDDDSKSGLQSVQMKLIRIYGTSALPKFGADGVMGAEVTTAVKHFQSDWSRFMPKDLLKIDGIPGIQTCARLDKAIQLGEGFPHS